MSSSESDHASNPEEGRPSERPPGRVSTIIVDPGLMAEAEQLSESQRPPAQANAEEAARESDESEAETAEHDRLSIEDAERFASAFRASWEPPAPAPHSNGNGHGADAHYGHAVAIAGAFAPASEPQATPVLLSELPGARRGRTMALGAAAFAGFIMIALLGWLASNSGVPDHPSADNPLAATPIQAKPEAAPVEAAPRPSEPPPQAPIAEPVPPAAPEVAAAPEAAPAPEVAAVPEAAPAPQATATPEPSEPAPALVALQITTRPQGAQLTLDGVPVSNPYDAMHSQGGRHVVEASAPGYRAEKLTIELTRKRSVALDLRKAPTPRAHVEPKRAAPKAAAAKPKRPRPAKPALKKGAAFTSESPY